jgi:hypothetical protein
LTRKDLCFKLVKSRNQEMALFNGDFDWFVSGFWPFDLENHGFVICDFPRRNSSRTWVRAPSIPVYAWDMSE